MKIKNLTKIFNVYIICILLIIISIFLRIPNVDKQNFNNADATYHVLLTMRAYDETQISVHKFLPIVSLGDIDNKYIRWGATVPDKYGNYYYTSFSSAGFFVPYLFIKLFHLPINELSLYAFNSLLYVLCFLLAVKIFVRLFKDEISKNCVIAIVALIYLFQPEIMHSQGMAYWHQSLYQLLFLIQLSVFMNLKIRKNLIIFYILCLIIPYVEWTGYISNMGFAFSFFFNKGITFNKNKINILINAVYKFLFVGVLTLFSFILFVLHFLSVLSWKQFITALTARFMARSVASEISYISLVQGYITSYGLLLAITFFLLIWILLIKKLRQRFISLIKKYKMELFIISFILIENIIMKEHAILYTYDRIKAIFVLIFIVLCIFSTFKFIYPKKVIITATFSVLVLIAIVNSYYYTQRNNFYRWEVNYLEANRLIASNINSIYTNKNSIIAHDKVSTRGYANVLFGRGIYEKTSFENAKEIAIKNKKQYVVLLQCIVNHWNMYDYESYIVYDVINNRYIEEVN